MAERFNNMLTSVQVKMVRGNLWNLMIGRYLST